jgi:HEAT repeat protein
MTMKALMLASVCVALVGGIRLPSAIRGLDDYAASNAWVATPGVLTIKTRLRSSNEIAKYLRQSNSPHRDTVIESLVYRHTDAVLLPVLIHLLSDENAEVRHATARTLDHWAENQLRRSATGSQEELASAVHALAIALNHEDAVVRQYAVRFLDDPNFFDHRSYASLPPSTVPVLIQASQRPEENVRNRARIILKSVERVQRIDSVVP